MNNSSFDKIDKLTLRLPKLLCFKKSRCTTPATKFILAKYAKRTVSMRHLRFTILFITR